MRTSNPLDSRLDLAKTWQYRRSPEDEAVPDTWQEALSEAPYKSLLLALTCKAAYSVEGPFGQSGRASGH